MQKLSRQLSRRSFLGAGAALATNSGLAAAPSNTRESNFPLSLPNDVGVSILVDALRSVGRDAMSLTMTPDIRPLTDHPRTVIGSVVTTKWQAGRGRMTADDVRRNMFEPLDEAPDGSIWVVAGGSEKLVSLFGGIIGAACKRNGLAAAVTDNGCRDIVTFNEVGFPVFARGSIPYGPGDIVRPVDANVPVVCGGVEVRPGDTIAADVDGVVVIPSEVQTDVFKAAEEILRKEKAMMDKIDAGEKLADAYRI